MKRGVRHAPAAATSGASSTYDSLDQFLEQLPHAIAAATSVAAASAAMRAPAGKAATAAAVRVKRQLKPSSSCLQ